MKLEVVIMFWARPSLEVISRLKAEGLRWQAARRTWEGYADAAEMRRLVGNKGMVIDVLKPGKDKKWRR